MAQWASPEEAIRTIQPTDHVVLPPGCGETLELERELGRQSERLQDLSIYSGLLLSDYPFLVPDAKFQYGTWHVMGPVRQLLESGDVEFYPIRGSQVVELFRSGARPIDVAFIHVSPPDKHGYCSLGTSVSYPYSLSRLAKRVIAQVNPKMPRTCGRSFVSMSDIDVLVEVDEPLVEYEAAKIGPVSRAIGEHVAELIPDGAMLQIGIGAIPEAVLASLVASGRRDLTLFGMGTDSVVDLAEADVLRTDTSQGPGVIGAELMGTAKLFDYVSDNPLVEMHPSEFVLNAIEIGRFDHVISVNSALQIDLSGQVNSEYIAGKQIGGIGGSFDFIQGAWNSQGGCTIFALPAADDKKRYSRIVAELARGAPVSVPRHFVQTVVTEFGVAHLQSLSLRARAEALIAVADPAFHDELLASVR